MAVFEKLLAVNDLSAIRKISPELSGALKKKRFSPRALELVRWKLDTPHISDGDREHIAGVLGKAVTSGALKEEDLRGTLDQLAGMAWHEKTEDATGGHTILSELQILFSQEEAAKPQNFHPIMHSLKEVPDGWSHHYPGALREGFASGAVNSENLPQAIKLLKELPTSTMAKGFASGYITAENMSHTIPMIQDLYASGATDRDFFERLEQDMQEKTFSKENFVSLLALMRKMAAEKKNPSGLHSAARSGLRYGAIRPGEFDEKMDFLYNSFAKLGEPLYPLSFLSNAMYEKHNVNLENFEEAVRTLKKAFERHEAEGHSIEPLYHLLWELQSRYRAIDEDNFNEAVPLVQEMAARQAKKGKLDSAFETSLFNAFKLGGMNSKHFLKVAGAVLHHQREGGDATPMLAFMATPAFRPKMSGKMIAAAPHIARLSNYLHGVESAEDHAKITLPLMHDVLNKFDKEPAKLNEEAYWRSVSLHAKQLRALRTHLK